MADGEGANAEDFVAKVQALDGATSEDGHGTEANAIRAVGDTTANGEGVEADASASIVTSLMFTEAPALDAIVAGFRKRLWSCNRFNSCVGGQSWVNKSEDLDASYHVSEEQVDDEDAARAWARRQTSEPLDASRPAWRIVVLRVPSPARSAVVLQLHKAVADGIGDGDSQLSELEATLSVSLPPSSQQRPPAREAAVGPVKKRQRSTSPEKRAQKPKAEKPPSAGELARRAISELDAQAREPVPEKEAVTAAIEAVQAVNAVNSNQKGGGGSNLFHEKRVSLHGAVLDLPQVHRAHVLERLEHMMKVFVPKTPGSYRAVCVEIEAYLQGIT